MGPVIHVPPGSGESLWQPVPANGYITIGVAPDMAGGMAQMCAGLQSVDPGCFVREHVHPDNDELFFFHQGTGHVEVNGAPKQVEPGTMLYVGRGNRHRIVNGGEGVLLFLWVLAPNGLEDFFRRIGRRREPGEAPPAPFPRPDDVKRIEQETVFADIGPVKGAP